MKDNVTKFPYRQGSPMVRYINTVVTLARQNSRAAVREYLNKRVPVQLVTQVAVEADKIIGEK